MSVIVPTYREAQNLPELIARLRRVADENRLDLELLIMDDNSQDGTVEVIAGLKQQSWVRLVTRTRNRGLSPAVLDGLRLARHPLLAVMDADLSHPPEKLPELIQALGPDGDMVFGSRYLPGGSTDDRWTAFRWINSKVATLLARPFTRISDPMSGYFLLRRSLLDKAPRLNPIGYKIGLELLVKCRCRIVREVPIHFTTRRYGQSKLNLGEQLRYLIHILRLLRFRLGLG